ncbi:FAST kinase domain-containing protein 4 [Brachionichthys hirsutus]|uniref:FAST kinase domain-containing protein 4 n=1 Tax=Brachionichthys hirsutus TaxID=412623 RepID=UPI003604348F
MATRLFGRCAGLACRTSFQTPAAAYAAARLPILLDRPAFHRAQGWPLVTVTSMCDRGIVPQKNTRGYITESRRLDSVLEKATVPDDILLAWAEYGGSAEQTAKALVRWTHLMLRTNGKFEDQQPNVTNDSRVMEMMDIISCQVNYVWNSTLVSVWHALSLMGLPSTDSAPGSVKTEILWRIRKLSYKQLGLLAEWGLSERTQKDVEVVNAALKQLELRWTEMASPRTVSALMAKGQSMSPYFLDRLQDKALELAETFTSQEISKICLSLAAQSRRPVPLLRTLSYHLLRKPSSEFTPPLIIDMAFAYGKLGFHQPQLFERMASEVLPEVPKLGPADVTRFCKSLGFLKWLHIPLFDTFVKHYIDNSQNYSTNQISNLLMTFARVNFLPSNGDEFFSKIHPVLEDCLADLEPFLRTDVVWSLCVLQQAKPHYLIPLTRQDYIQQMSGASAVRMENYKLKLLHIAASLQLEHSVSSHSPPSLSDMFSPVTSTSLTPLQISLRDALQSFVAGKTESLRTGVQTVYGWIIDGELLVDGDNKLLSLAMLKDPHLPSGGGDRALPAGSLRVAFLAWEFPNFCSKSKDLMGRFVLMKRHLQLAGFMIVEVPYYEWLELRTDWQKLGWLKDKIGKVVAKDMAK